MEEEVKKLIDDLEKYSENMGERVEAGVIKAGKASYEADIVNSLVSEGKIANPAKLTAEENLLVKNEVKKVRRGEKLEGIKKIAKAFFDKEQETLEAMQESLNTLIENAKKEEEQVEKDLKALEEKQAAHEEDDKNPELTEDEKKELIELQKKNDYFKNKFPKRLQNMKQNMALARSTIKYQKEALNVKCQKLFGGFVISNNTKNEDRNIDYDNQNGNRTDPENKPKKEEEIPGEDEPIVGNEQNNNDANQTQGQQTNQRAPQGGFGMPMFGGMPMGQQQAPFVGGGQVPQQAGQTPTQQNENPTQEQDEHLPTEEEIFGSEESPIFRFKKDEMTASEALEFIRRYSTFCPEDRKKCINAGGLDVIKKATETLNVKGGSLSQADKNLLAEYSKTISKSSMEMADTIAKGLEKPAAGGQTLSNALKMHTDDPEFKKILEYFTLGGKLFSKNGGNLFSKKKKPEVLYNYDKLPSDVKDLLDKAQDDFIKRQEDAQLAIENEKRSLNDPNVPAEEKNKIKENIAQNTDKMLRDKQNFDRTLGSLIRAGKAIAYNKKIEEMANRVQSLTAERNDEPQEHDEADNFQDNLHNQTRDDDDRAQENAEKINQKFQENLEKFVSELEKDIAGGNEISFNDYLNYHQYVQYALKGKYGLSIDALEKVDMSKANRAIIDRWNDAIEETIERVNKIEKTNKEDLTEDMLLDASELNILVGTNNIDIERIGKYAKEGAVKKFKEEYDLRSKAEKEVEEEDKSKGEPDLDDPTID